LILLAFRTPNFRLGVTFQARWVPIGRQFSAALPR